MSSSKSPSKTPSNTPTSISTIIEFTTKRKGKGKAKAPLQHVTPPSQDTASVLSRTSREKHQNLDREFQGQISTATTLAAGPYTPEGQSIPVFPGATNDSDHRDSLSPKSQPPLPNLLTSEKSIEEQSRPSERKRSWLKSLADQLEGVFHLLTGMSNNETRAVHPRQTDPASRDKIAPSRGPGPTIDHSGDTQPPPRMAGPSGLEETPNTSARLQHNSDQAIAGALYSGQAFQRMKRPSPPLSRSQRAECKTRQLAQEALLRGFNSVRPVMPLPQSEIAAWVDEGSPSNDGSSDSHQSDGHSGYQTPMELFNRPWSPDEDRPPEDTMRNVARPLVYPVPFHLVSRSKSYPTTIGPKPFRTATTSLRHDDSTTKYPSHSSIDSNSQQHTDNHSRQTRKYNHLDVLASSFSDSSCPLEDSLHEFEPLQVLKRDDPPSLRSIIDPNLWPILEGHIPATLTISLPTNLNLSSKIPHSLIHNRSSHSAPLPSGHLVQRGWSPIEIGTQLSDKTLQTPPLEHDEGLSSDNLSQKRCALRTPRTPYGAHRSQTSSAQRSVKNSIRKAHTRRKVIRTRRGTPKTRDAAQKITRALREVRSNRKLVTICYSNDDLSDKPTLRLRGGSTFWSSPTYSSASPSLGIETSDNNVQVRYPESSVNASTSSAMLPGSTPQQQTAQSRISVPADRPSKPIAIFDVTRSVMPGVSVGNLVPPWLWAKISAVVQIQLDSALGSIPPQPYPSHLPWYMHEAVLQKLERIAAGDLPSHFLPLMQAAYASRYGSAPSATYNFQPEPSVVQRSAWPQQNRVLDELAKLSTLVPLPPSPFDPSTEGLYEPDVEPIDQPSNWEAVQQVRPNSAPPQLQATSIPSLTTSYGNSNKACGAQFDEFQPAVPGRMQAAAGPCTTWDCPASQVGAQATTQYATWIATSPQRESSASTSSMHASTQVPQDIYELWPEAFTTTTTTGPAGLDTQGVTSIPPAVQEVQSPASVLADPAFSIAGLPQGSSVLNDLLFPMAPAVDPSAGWGVPSQSESSAGPPGTYSTPGMTWLSAPSTSPIPYSPPGAPSPFAAEQQQTTGYDAHQGSWSTTATGGHNQIQPTQQEISQSQQFDFSALSPTWQAGIDTFDTPSSLPVTLSVPPTSSAVPSSSPETHHEMPTWPSWVTSQPSNMTTPRRLVRNQSPPLSDAASVNFSPSPRPTLASSLPVPSLVDRYGVSSLSPTNQWGVPGFAQYSDLQAWRPAYTLPHSINIPRLNLIEPTPQTSVGSGSTPNTPANNGMTPGNGNGGSSAQSLRKIGDLAVVSESSRLRTGRSRSRSRSKSRARSRSTSVAPEQASEGGKRLVVPSVDTTNRARRSRSVSIPSSRSTTSYYPSPESRKSAQELWMDMKKLVGSKQESKRLYREWEIKNADRFKREEEERIERYKTAARIEWEITKLEEWNRMRTLGIGIIDPISRMELINSPGGTPHLVVAGQTEIPRLILDPSGNKYWDGESKYLSALERMEVGNTRAGSSSDPEQRPKKKRSITDIQDMGLWEPEEGRRKKSRSTSGSERSDTSQIDEQMEDEAERSRKDKGKGRAMHF
ncbi:uncharacterized protein I206_106138 [Kwoniella pini CBS 10737]|uniref:Uncharacterized protein n=1 Tax=Kwoniella pini CBS 10737 TaxID=1296096 RepID=A0A1B9I174_9TREE|nr:uncharacterized protein I206_04963 [Kwoniella pini CBS 10737]OCF49274.1 hypothetical protein I206_04963 [Kwoniella pini CBS 10737]